MYLPGFDPSPCFAEMISHVFPKFGISTVLNPQNPWVNHRFPACNSDLLKKNTQNWSHTQISSHIKFLLNLFPMKYDPNLVVNHFMVAFFASGDIVERFPRFAPIGPVMATKACSTRRLLKMGISHEKKWEIHHEIIQCEAPSR